MPDPSNRPHLHFSNYCQALDILPLLRTYARFPDAHLTFHPSAAYLAALFHVHSEPVWRATLLSDLHAVRLFHDYWGKIHMRVRGWGPLRVAVESESSC